MLRFGELLRGSSHRVERSLVILTRTINGAHDCLIALNQNLGIHSSSEVEGALGVVSGSFTEQAPFAVESLPELGVRQRVEQAHHRQRYGALANEINLSLENICRIIIEPDDEAGHHLHAITLNHLYRVEQVATVLRFLSFFKTLLAGGFNPEKHAAETCVSHAAKQRFVIGEIHARFGD